MREHWSLAAEDFDLTLANRRITDFCRRHGIRCLDLLSAMRAAAAAQSLFLPFGDMHFNEAGNRCAARATAQLLALHDERLPPQRGLS